MNRTMYQYNNEDEEEQSAWAEQGFATLQAAA
jgi:hypothetical protein